MKPFTLQSKVTKNGKVKVRINNQEDSYPIYMNKYPNLQTKKYYTIQTIDPIDEDNIIPNKYKDSITESIETFKHELNKNSITIKDEIREESFLRTPELTAMKNKRDSCEWFRL
jgi:hypothetical protein